MNNEMIVNSIKNLCKENNITIGQLEKEVGLSQGLVSKWKDKTPSLDKIVDIADYFNVSLDEVIGRKQEIINYNKNNNFVLNLINITRTDKVQWKMLLNGTSYDTSYRIIAEPNCDIKNFSNYPDNCRKIEIYMLKYNNAYITLYCFLITNLNSIELCDFSLFIQAQANTDPVYQNCDKNLLYKLYISIAYSICGKTPEMLANDFKETFIREQENNELDSFNKSISEANIPSPNDIDTFFNNPGTLEALSTINDESIKKIADTFTSPQMLNMIESMSRLQKYIQEIEKIKTDK